jgi:hypothetical protein
MITFFSEKNAGAVKYYITIRLEDRTRPVRFHILQERFAGLLLDHALEFHVQQAASMSLPR